MGQRILVVDDLQVNRIMLQGLLSNAGYSVEVAEDGAEALGILTQEQFDLIVLDLLMPGMNGFELLDRLKGTVPPVIVLSALSDMDSIKRSLDLGAIDYVAKPFSIQTLLAKVRNVLDKS
ncbi:MAG: response regulator [Bacteroidales bacterium]|nr:response regulator [Bacteroidales bacterium]MBN2750727.1 response regulator [Bacteroidales bacterium]